ncbi:prostasin-like isoform X2 [Drosophila ficusphila]|uniref:prostasin-like isoform X2 n=1 Tax=Drosophila ficusphila TaxID=30025 RepID=UPI0007E6E73F|nr:prostasin-like isoform X2 [Drosophila ficusphila]
MKTFSAWIPLFVLLLGHQAASQFLEPSCGFVLNPNKNGGVTQPSAWMASISNATQFLCGGSLIHRRFVLGAAHCINGQTSLYVNLGDDTTTQERHSYTVTSAIIHRLFSEENLESDIALLKLSHSVDFSDKIFPICIVLDTSIKSFVQMTLKFNTYAIDPNSSGEDFLRITIDHLNPKQCKQIMAVGPNSNQICVAYPSPQIENVDSGNPLSQLLILDPSTNSYREVQVGIASRINSIGTGFYTDVVGYGAWISEKIKDADTEDLPETVQPGPTRPTEAHNSRSPSVAQNQGIWLYSDCGGYNLESYLMAEIRGANYFAHGVFITDRFIITIANGLPNNIKVIPMGVNTYPYPSVAVDSINIHPSFSGDYQHNIALIKLRQPVNINGLKPICLIRAAKKMFQRGLESSPPFAFHDAVLTETKQIISTRNVELANPADCSTNQSVLGESQLCVPFPPVMNQLYGYRGDVLGKQMMYSGKEWFALFGLVSYTTDRAFVLTNVMKYSDWIEHVITNT